MDNVSPQGFQQGAFRPSESLATAPPPPAEVKIRTMRSDLDSTARNGGGSPIFQNIRVGENAVRKTAPFVAPVVAPASSATPVGEVAAPTIASPKTNIFGIVATIIIFIVLILGAWFAYAKFFGNTPVSQQQPPSATPTETPAAAPAAQTPSSTATQSSGASVPVLILPSTASGSASSSAR